MFKVSSTWECNLIFILKFKKQYMSKQNFASCSKFALNCCIPGWFMFAHTICAHVYNLFIDISMFHFAAVKPLISLYDLDDFTLSDFSVLGSSSVLNFDADTSKREHASRWLCAPRRHHLSFSCSASCMRPSPVFSHCRNSCRRWTVECGSHTDYLDIGLEPARAPISQGKLERKILFYSFFLFLQKHFQSFCSFLFNWTILYIISRDEPSFPHSAFISDSGVQLE